MIVEQITLTAFQQHTRLLGCAETRRAVCVDPGEETGEIVAALERLGLGRNPRMRRQQAQESRTRLRG